ncbi:hypothetical protein GCM10009774_20370 [Cellulomonas gelida]|uniref:Uncharacterized protein n=1 Tax=Cellulomonas gelida TaxID=1712 RepID=A0A4Y3KJK6_9CELL|nr:hypothetical protein CGE01nite_03810 [Cellulomonas gelida]GGL29952.1 hypothetical protein GCM10009774_20370 [Cellulomonas gelida]
MPGYFGWSAVTVRVRVRVVDWTVRTGSGTATIYGADDVVAGRTAGEGLRCFLTGPTGSLAS